MQVSRWLFFASIAVAFICGLVLEYYGGIVRPLGTVFGRAVALAWVQQIFLVAVGVVSGLAVGLVLFNRLPGKFRETKPPQRPEPRGGEFEREEMRRKVRAARGQ